MRRYPGKYGAKPKDGFHSTKEARRYKELDLMQHLGIISNLRCQVKFELIPAKKGRYREERSCSYTADFVYIDRDEGEIVEDVKGYKTTDYVIKRKLMLAKGISIKET